MPRTTVKPVSPLKIRIFERSGRSNSVIPAKLHRFFRRTRLIFESAGKSVLAVLIKSENVQFPVAVCNEVGPLKHLAHVKFSPIAVSPERSLVKAARGCGWVAPALKRFVDTLGFHPAKVDVLENGRFTGSPVPEVEDNMLLIIRHCRFLLDIRIH